MKEKVSVIVPCYNVENRIDRCVMSLMNQTIDKEMLEIILVNDASTDDTLQHLLDWEKEYPENILVINLSENVRQGGARNVGLEYASGDYIGFVDYDDYVNENMYEEMYSALISKEVDCVICGRYEQTEEGKLYDLGMVDNYLVDLRREQYPFFVLQSVAYYGIVQMLLKRTVLERFNLPFPKNVAYEDNYWCGLLVYYLGKVYVMNKSFYYYCVNSKSTVQARNAPHQLDRFKMEVCKMKTAMDRGLYEFYQEDLEYQFVKYYFLNGILSLLNHFDEIPKGIIENMIREVKEWCPDLSKNLLINHYLREEDREILSLMDYPFYQGNRQEVLLGIATYRRKKKDDFPN